MRVEPGRPVGYDRGRDRPPPRPATLADLPFEPQPAVRWYSPKVLAATGLQVALSAAFGAYLDKRELQTVLDQEAFTALAARDEAWVDFVADTGDGFDATYTVASLVGRSELVLDGLAEPLPRADALVFGGDLVYPDATAKGYRHHFEGPYKAALPWTPPDRRPALFAIPGNHDWYDGATAFMRVIGQQKAIGGWQTYQTRSYFALQLPSRWWLWGIDVEFDAYIDEPQLRFFEGLDVQPGDQIVLCTSEPSWVAAAGDPGAYGNLGYVERRLITPQGAHLALTLGGHLHHYSRYAAAGGGQKIIAGGGGAFLFPTHAMPPEAPVRTDPDDAGTETVHSLVATYPTPARSRLLVLGALAMPLRNPSFMVVPAVLYLLLTAQVLGGLRARADEAADAGAEAAAGAQLVELLRGVSVGEAFARVFSEPLALGLVVLLLIACVYFTTPPPHTAARVAPWARRGLGVAHTLMHVAAVALVAWVVLRLAALAPPGWPVTVAAYAGALVLGAVVGSFTFALYLTLANATWGAEANHAFSAQRLPGYKNFLRLHVRPDGSLTVYAVGIDRAGTRWRAVPHAAEADDAWIAPAGQPLAPHLIEQITLPAAHERPRPDRQPGAGDGGIQR